LVVVAVVERGGEGMRRNTAVGLSCSWNENEKLFRLFWVAWSGHDYILMELSPLVHNVVDEAMYS